MQIYPIIIVIGSVLFSLSQACLAKPEDYKAYLGLDSQFREIKFNEGQGKNFFKEPDFEYSIYAGRNLASWIDVEMGYHTNKRKKSREIWNANQIKLGHLETEDKTFDLKTKLDGYFFNSLFYTPLSDHFYLDAIWLFGVSRERLKLDAKIVTLSGVNASATDQRNHNFDLTETKYIPRIGTGLRFRLTKYVGFRALLVWERTTVFTPSGGASSDPPGDLQANAKNSFLFNLGVFVSG